MAIVKKERDVVLFRGELGGGEKEDLLRLRKKGGKNRLFLNNKNRGERLLFLRKGRKRKREGSLRLLLQRGSRRGKGEDEKNKEMFDLRKKKKKKKKDAA